jgi:hypothetical protein
MTADEDMVKAKGSLCCCSARCFGVFDRFFFRVEKCTAQVEGLESAGVWGKGNRKLVLTTW